MICTPCHLENRSLLPSQRGRPCASASVRRARSAARLKFPYHSCGGLLSSRSKNRSAFLTSDRFCPFGQTLPFAGLWAAFVVAGCRARWTGFTVALHLPPSKVLSALLSRCHRSARPLAATSSCTIAASSRRNCRVASWLAVLLAGRVTGSPHADSWASWAARQEADGQPRVRPTKRCPF
jgi:hypothetical protein